MKNTIKFLLALMLTLTLTGCSAPKNQDDSVVTSDSSTEEKITLTFTIIDASKEEPVTLFDGPVEVSADCETLIDVIHASPQLEAKTEAGMYGMAILGLMGVEGDWDKGPWWLYESENNEACQAAGYCDGASALKIQDGDIFIFTLSSNF